MLEKQEAIIKHFCEKYKYDFINDSDKSFTNDYRVYCVDYVVLDDANQDSPVEDAYFFIEIITMADADTFEILWVQAIIYDISNTIVESHIIDSASSFGYKAIFERLNYLYDGLR